MDKQKMRGAKNSQEAANWANEKEEESLARILQNSGLSTPIQLKCPADFCSYLFPSTALSIPLRIQCGMLTTVSGKTRPNHPWQSIPLQAQLISKAYLQLNFKQEQESSQVSFPTTLKMHLNASISSHDDQITTNSSLTPEKHQDYELDEQKHDGLGEASFHFQCNSTEGRITTGET